MAVGSRGTYTGANAEFVVPTISNNPSNAQVAIWAGMGGETQVTSPAVLVQAGVFINAQSNGQQYNESFWEVVPGNDPQNLPLCKLHQGDQVYVSVASNEFGSGQDYFYIENESAGCYNSTTDTNSSDFSDSATAECIVEAPLDRNGNILPLANFGTLTFNNSGCTIYQEGQATDKIGNYPHFYHFMYANPSTKTGLKASLGRISNGANYDVYWRSN